MTVGERIRSERTRAGLSRAELAKLADVPYPTLAGLENGDQKSSTRLHAIAAALKVRPEWLETGKEPREVAPSLSTGLPPQASQPLRPSGRTLAIAAGALIRFLARRDLSLDITNEVDAELLLEVVGEYEASRDDADADTAFVVALADLVQAYEVKRNAGNGRGSESAVGAA